MTDLHLNSLTDFVSGVTACTDLSKLDPLLHNSRFNAITMNRSLLASMYMEKGIVQVLIAQPVDDAFRGGIKLKCDELSADDIGELQDDIETFEVTQKYCDALKWMRLFGGAGVLINSGQDMTKPLKIESITDKMPLKFYAVDRWELSYAPTGLGSAVDQLYEPALDLPYNYYGHPIHKTHVIKLVGKEPPSLLRGQFGGWGMSELEKVIRSFNQYEKHQNVTYEILDECKLDIFSIQGFNASIASRDGAEKTARRVQLANQIKNYQNALVIDTEDKYENKTLTFSGLAEILTQIRIGLACDLRMPLAKLFGLSASGFSSGLDDIENYNSMVETEIRSKVKFGLITMLQILCQRRFGYVPDKMDFEWMPLRMMSNQEASLVKTEGLNRIISAFNNGIMPSDAAVEQINNEKIFGLDLETSAAMSLEEVKNLTGEDTTDGIGIAKTVGRTGKGL